jgi:propionate catabolism operon transcriptional regulator
VVISAGSNGAYLKSRLPVPVVVARASGFDVMQALARARQISARIGLVTYQERCRRWPSSSRCSGWTSPSAPTPPRKMRAPWSGTESRRHQAVVGAGLITDLAEEAGMQGIFLYSSATVRQAFEDALELARLTQLESTRGPACRWPTACAHGIT